MADIPINENTADKNSNLICVLYRSLLAVEACKQYFSDTKQAGSDEAAQFLREAQEQNCPPAQRAKGLQQQI